MPKLSIGNLTHWYSTGQVRVGSNPTKRGRLRKGQSWPIVVADPALLSYLADKGVITDEVNIPFKASVQGDGPTLAAVTFIESLGLKVSVSELFRYGAQQMAVELGLESSEVSTSLAGIRDRAGINK